MRSIICEATLICLFFVLLVNVSCAFRPINNGDEILPFGQSHPRVTRGSDDSKLKQPSPKIKKVSRDNPTASIESRIGAINTPVLCLGNQKIDTQGRCRTIVQ